MTSTYTTFATEDECTTEDEWFFEPADRQVGINAHAWIHEGCTVVDAVTTPGSKPSTA